MHLQGRLQLECPMAIMSLWSPGAKAAEASDGFQQQQIWSWLLCLAGRQTAAPAHFGPGLHCMLEEVNHAAWLLALTLTPQRSCSRRFYKSFRQPIANSRN